MKPPIFVYEKGPLYIFKSVNDAESYLEPIDVKNNEYVAYDSEGRLLCLSATSFHVTIESAELEPNHAPELRKILVGFLAYMKTPEDWLEIASLQDLVTKASEYKTS
jgi:hypothetical protein